MKTLSEKLIETKHTRLKPKRERRLQARQEVKDSKTHVKRKAG
jgi:hypothetical protein